MNAIEHARELNTQPLSGCLDREWIRPLLADRELIFSDTRVFVAQEHLDRMAAFAAAMERIAELPGWQEVVLKEAGETARHPTAASGVFFGYDFHIDAEGPKLIEINTNAGGGPLNVKLLKAQRENCDINRSGLADALEVEKKIVAMFRREWTVIGHSGAPGLIAIVDDAPAEQYLNPDFEIARLLLERQGLSTVICDAAELHVVNGELQCHGSRVDVVYNRLTDFFLDAPEHAALRQAWLSDAAVVTPNPRNYALYADKRHMVLLGDAAWLAQIGVSAADRALVAAVVPRTERVGVANAEDIRARRKQLFFKPATGYGSKATYRGQNVTTRVLAEIIAGDYVAQALVPPPTRMVEVDGVATELKFDLRCYTYRGDVLLTAARVWQGQTTNFRTLGGGFTPVVAV